MRWNLDAKSCALGVAVGAGAMLLVGPGGGENRAVGQQAAAPAAPMPVAGAPRYQIRTWASSNQGSGAHGAYVLDTYTGDVRELPGTGSERKFPNKD